MPKKVEISATLPKNEKKGIKEDRKATVIVNFGESAKESIQMYGDEAVNTNAFRNFRVTVQGAIRKRLENNMPETQIQKELADVKMGIAITGTRVDPLTASKAIFATMNKEERQAYLAELKLSAEQAA